jgi:hypothetical protein
VPIPARERSSHADQPFSSHHPADARRAPTANHAGRRPRLVGQVPGEPRPRAYAWIGALFNTFRLDGKTWFVALLVLCLFSFGWVAMVAYVVAGPDSTGWASDRGGATAGHI